MYELKWDGYRIAAVRDERGARLWSRQGKDLTARFPDLAAAVMEQVEPGTVLDAEAVIWSGDRLDFDLLQRRLVSGASRLPALVAAHPATLMVFDVLAHQGVDQRGLPLRQRRELLEELAARWRPPVQPTPSTTDLATAQAWFGDYRAAGIEGLVVKGAASAYTPGKRSWVKVKSRESTEVIVGAVTGTLTRPQTLVAGRFRDGVLRIVGRSTPLSTTQAGELATALTPAAEDHPWPDEVSSTRFGSSRDKVTLVKVEPLLVAEVLADTALQAGAYRHPLRYLRLRRPFGHRPRPLTGPPASRPTPVSEEGGGRRSA
ncbi:MAG: ATP-dependent DNA ligase [Nocardioidaceae bacterium]|nr:ATP-dependent DNA ligase [Nocardioidaceae bacterium]